MPAHRLIFVRPTAPLYTVHIWYRLEKQ